MNELPNIWLMQTTADVDALCEALSHPYADVRRRAAAALRIIGSSKATHALETALRTEKNVKARMAMIAALEHLLPDVEKQDTEDRKNRPQTRVERLIDYLMSNNPNTAVQAARALGDMGNKVAVPPLILTFRDRHKPPDVRLAAAEALLEMNSAPAEVTLLAALRSEKWHLRRNGAAILGQLRAEWAIKPLTDALYDPQEIVSKTARAALRRIGTIEARRALERAKRTQLDTAQLDVSVLDRLPKREKLDKKVPTLPSRPPGMEKVLSDNQPDPKKTTAQLQAPPPKKPQTGKLKEPVPGAEPTASPDIPPNEDKRPTAGIKKLVAPPPPPERVKSQRRKSATQRLTPPDEASANSRPTQPKKPGPPPAQER